MIDDETRAALLSDDDARIAEALAHLSLGCDVDLDCGDASCRSPMRGRGGMRTNGGCRCSIVEVAVRWILCARAAGDVISPEHGEPSVRHAVSLIRSPSGRREVETGRVRG